MEFDKYMRYDRAKGKLFWSVNYGRVKDGDEVGDINKGYRRFGLRYVKYYVSTVVWWFETGVITKGLLKHINGNKLDTRFSNLREQKHNMRPEVTTGKYDK